MKELFSFVLIFVMILSTFASCSSSPNGNESTAAGATSASDGAESENEKNESTANSYPSEKYISSFPRSDIKIISAYSSTDDGALCLKLYNSGDGIELLEFNVTDADKVYSFKATAFLSGATVIVREKNGEKYRDGFFADDIDVVTCAYFSSTPSLNASVLDITTDSGVINVKNVSDFDVKNVYIYYKRVYDGAELGDTYRINAGDIASGEIKQSSSQNLFSGEYKIIFTTYEK